MEKKNILLGALGLLLLGGAGTGLFLLSRSSHSPTTAGAPGTPASSVANSPTTQTSPANLVHGGASTGSSTSAASAVGTAGTQPGTTTTASGPAGIALTTPSLPSGGLPSLPGAAPGTVAGVTGTTGTQVAVAPAVPAATPVPDACYTITYHHKAVSGHTDEEACSHHKNLIQFKHDNVNAKNVCVRVNGTPVHFLTVKDHANQVLIGAVAGPKSKLTVSYCVGKATCQVKEDCTVPKDEFMEAIGGTTADVSKDARLGQWDPSLPSDKEADVLAKLDGDVKRELETNHELNGRSRRGEMFKDWMSDNEGPACGVRQAQN